MLTVGDSDLVRLSSALLNSRDVQDTVGIDVEGDLNLRNTAGSRRDAGKLELAQQVVVLRARTLALKDLDQHARLVVRKGGEDLRLLGGNGSVALDQGSHDTTSSLDTERQRSHVEKEDLLRLGRCVASEDSRLHGSTIGNRLVGVDRLVGLLSVEEVRDELLDLGNASGTADEDDLVDRRLVDLGVAEDALDGVHGGTEEVLAKLLEAGTRDRGVEVDTLVERVDLNRRLGRRRESALGTLASGPQATESTGIAGQVLLVLALELLDEVVDETVVEVLTTQVCVAGSCLNLEDTLFNGQEGHIEGSSTEIEDEDIALAGGLLVEAVGDGSGSRLVDDTENVEAGDHAGVLSSLALGIIEVGRDGNDSIVDCATEVGLSGFPHLGKDHRGNFLGRELLGLSLELNLDERLAALVDDFERKVLHVRLNLRLLEFPSDQSLGIEDSVVPALRLVSGRGNKKVKSKNKTKPKSERNEKKKKKSREAYGFMAT